MTPAPQPTTSSSASSTIATTTTAPPARTSKAPSRKSWLPLSKVSELTTKFLNPNFRNPPRLRIPSRPSIRASLLPSPCAELDERPRVRVRRFMLWKDRVPPLRKIVLDPRKKIHLRRFNIFQIPSNPRFQRGIRIVPGDFKTHASYLFQTQGERQERQNTSVTLPNASEPHPELATSLIPSSPSPSGHTAPLSMPAPRTKRLALSTTLESATSASLGDVGTPKLPATSKSPTSTAPQLHRAPTIRPVQTISPTGIVPAQAGGLMAPPSIIQAAPPIPAPVQQVTILPTKPGQPIRARVRSTPQSRKAERARILQHCFVLEQQAERRYRIALRFLVLEMIQFQQENTISTGPKQRPTWIEDPDIESIQRGITVMKSIRDNSRNIWPLLEEALSVEGESYITKPVPGLNEAKEKVKVAKKKRDDLKKAKAAKQRAAQEAKAKGDPSAQTQVSAGTSTPATQAGMPTVARRPIIILQRPKNLSPGSGERSDKPRYIAISARVAKRSGSGSESSLSDQLVTPTTSQTSQAARTLDVTVDPVPEAKSTIQPEPGLVTPDQLRSMGLDKGIPDEIAHQLAEMLSKFQAIGLERKRAKAQREAKSGKPDFDEVNYMSAQEMLSKFQAIGLERKRAKARRKDKSRKPDFDGVNSSSEQNHASRVITAMVSKKGRNHSIHQVSIETSEESGMSSDDCASGKSQDGMRSWATNDLNMDDDTNALSAGSSASIA